MEIPIIATGNSPVVLFILIHAIAINQYSCVSPSLPTPKEGDGPCPMLSQLQSAVIQLFGTNYEFGQGIHGLHSMVEHLQTEVLDIQSCQHEVKAIQQALTLTPTNISTADMLARTITFLGHYIYEDYHKDTSLESLLQKLNNSLQLQENYIRRMHKRLHQLRKMIMYYQSQQAESRRSNHVSITNFLSFNSLNFILIWITNQISTKK